MTASPPAGAGEISKRLGVPGTVPTTVREGYFGLASTERAAPEALPLCTGPASLGKPADELILKKIGAVLRVSSGRPG